ncbi:hypothetical protein ACFXG4_03220 [Nocardia sp. NPDC059246]|uniref:hypothetical protein n=1 Tax=unclassified Nocardia TaxID=2637762 RepID=UPI003684506D
MLVINGDGSRVPGTEKEVPDWLRIWNGDYRIGDYRIGGIAISGCYIPDRRPGHSGNATEADLVIITPQLCVVIQVEGLTEPVDGQMTCPAALLRALNLADAVSFADLAAEGFACAAPSPSPAAGARSARPAPTLAGNPWLDLADDPGASFRASRGTGRWRRRFLRRPATGGES